MKYPTSKRILCFLLAAVMTLLLCPVVGAEGETIDPNICQHCGVAVTELEYQVWNETTAFAENTFTGDNHYRLEADITLTARILVSEGACLVLDLNGHTITAAAEDRVFLLYGAMTLLDTSENKTGALVGGDLTGRALNGGTVYVSEKGCFIMLSGTVRDGKAINGGNIYSSSKATRIWVLGGTVCNGTAVPDKEKTGRGGNIYTNCDTLISGDAMIRDGYAQYQHTGTGRGGNLFVNGSIEAVISGNAKIIGGYAAGRGGNILVNAYGVLTIRENAEIYGGIAKNYANNVDILTSTFNMEGGTIYGSPAGGCQVNISTYSTLSEINISGGKIYGRFETLADIPINISGDAFVEHLYLPKNAYITPGKLEKTAKIGVEVAATSKIFTEKLEDTAVYQNFCDYSGETVASVTENGQLYLTTGTACQCCGQDVNTINWITLTDGMNLVGNEGDRVATHYRLENNLTSTVRPNVEGSKKPVTLDLNGFVLTAAPTFAAFAVKDNTTFNIVDNTADKEGKIVGSGERNAAGGVLYVAGSTKTLNLYGGTISGGKIVGDGHYGGGIYIESATFNMYGGTVSGNSAEGHGGNLFVSGTAKFNMYGGTFSDGIANGGGGGNIYITSAYAHAYIYDGLITGGQSVTYTGGNIMVNSGANLHIYGGIIEYGAAYKWGGNIYVGSSRTFSDGTKKYSSCEIFGGTFGAEDDSLGKVDNLDRGSTSNPFVIYNATIHNQAPQTLLAECSCYAVEDNVTTIWNYGHGGDCDSTCPMETAWGTLKVTELNQGNHEFTVSGQSCQCGICKYTYYGENIAAVAGGKIYEDLQEALHNAPLNSTVAMLKDVVATEVVVSEITLDLNGYSLTADTFTSAVSGSVIDTSYKSAGKLVCNSVTFAEGNTYLPVTFDDGIHFCAADFTQWLERVDENTTKVKFYFTQRAADTIIDDAIRDGSTELDVQIRLTWKDSAGQKQDKTFVFDNELLQKYTEKWNGRVFVTTIGGVDKITELKCTYQVGSTAASGTKVVSTTLNNVAYIKDKLSWEDINSFPIKHSSMTVDEMRDLVVSFMEYTKTYLWTPDQTVNYIRNASGSKDSMKQGTVYGGLPYVGVASGNVYRMMDYLNPVTGLLDMKKALPALETKDQLAMSDLKYFGSQCSISVYWAWGRLINSVNYQWTYNTVPKNGFILLGDMVLPDIDKWTAEYNTTMACHENGEQATYSNYAAAKKADVLVYYIESSGGDGAGHLMMLYEDAYVEYNEVGTINGEKSYLTIIDQGQSWKSNTNAAGDKFSHKGNIAQKKTFKAMYDYGYVAFTYEEFVNGDPLEETQVSLKNGETTYVSGTIDENTGIYNSTQEVTTLTKEELFSSTITSNYGIADAYIILYNAYGEEIYRHAVRVGQAGRTSLNLVESGAMVTTWEHGTVLPGRTYQMQIEVQLATGERPVIFEGNFVA